MSIKKLLTVAGALALAACGTTDPQFCQAIEGTQEEVCSQLPTVEEPQVEPAGE